MTVTNASTMRRTHSYPNEYCPPEIEWVRPDHCETAPGRVVIMVGPGRQQTGGLRASSGTSVCSTACSKRASVAPTCPVFVKATTPSRNSGMKRTRLDHHGLPPFLEMTV